MPNDDTDTPITLREAAEANEAHDQHLDDIGERLELLRRSLRASLDGEHQRAADLLDELERLDETEGEL
jgi:archaellum component FlaC